MSSIKKIIIPKKYVINKIIKKFNLYLTDLLKYDFEYLYDNLERNQDKQFLLQVISYRVLGNTRVKLTNYKEHNKNIQIAKQYVDFNDFIYVSEYDKYKLYKVNFFPKKFSFYSSPLGYACELYEHPYSIPGLFSVEKNDYVIDCGGYILDTAIPFADVVGENGKIFVFEFIEDNLAICEKNLSLNPSLKERIEIIKKPLSSKDGEVLEFIEDSSCSKKIDVGDKVDMSNKHINKYTSITIDTFVEERGLDKVSFIKMDIEGSELEALKGAEKTIKKFHPKLAISIYHKIEDLEKIPKIIKKFDDGYKFYISYTGVVDSEFILCAKYY